MTIAAVTNKPTTPPMHAYASLLLRLHDLIAEGSGDAEEADAVRDQMDEPWLAMTAIERELVGGLSEDLYALADGSANYKETTSAEQEEWVSEVRKQLAALGSGNTSSAFNLLAFLRAPRSHEVNAKAILLARAECWGTLGQQEVALRFIQEAERLNSTFSMFELKGYSNTPSPLGAEGLG